MNTASPKFSYSGVTSTNAEQSIEIFLVQILSWQLAQKMCMTCLLTSTLLTKTHLQLRMHFFLPFTSWMNLVYQRSHNFGT